MPFPDGFLETARSLELLGPLTVYMRAKRVALGSRRVFPGWAGMLAETALISLAKIGDEAAKIRAILLQRGSAR